MKRLLIINDLLIGGEVENLMQALVRCWHTRYEITVMTEDYQEGFYDYYPEDVKYITARPANCLNECIAACPTGDLNENIDIDSSEDLNENIDIDSSEDLNENIDIDLSEDLNENIDIDSSEDLNENIDIDLAGNSNKYITVRSKMHSNGNLLERCIYAVHKRIHTRRFVRQTAPGTFDIILCMKEGWLMKKYFYLRAPVRYAWVHTDYQSDERFCGVYDNNKQEIVIMKTYSGIICISEQVKKSIQETIGDPGNLLVGYDLDDVENVLKKA